MWTESVLTTVVSATAGILGVALGWFLNELSGQILARRRHKAAIGRALAELLEIWHFLSRIRVYIGEIKSRVSVSDEDLRELRTFVDTLLGPDMHTAERYSNALAEIAEADPLLAFQLRSQGQRQIGFGSFIEASVP